VIDGRDSLSKVPMPALAQSTTSGEEDSAINADSVFVICRVRYKVEGVQSLALADASNKSPGGKGQMSMTTSTHGEQMVELECHRVEE
jgi:hypothetical protein